MKINNHYTKQVNIVNHDGNKHNFTINGEDVSKGVTRISIEICGTETPTLTVETVGCGVESTHKLNIKGLNIFGLIDDEADCVLE